MVSGSHISREIEKNRNCLTCLFVCVIDIEDISKAPSEPTSITKESRLIEDEAPWRRPTAIRLNQSNQNENPPKSECSGNIHESRFPTHFTHSESI